MLGDVHDFKSSGLLFLFVIGLNWIDFRGTGAAVWLCWASRGGNSSEAKACSENADEPNSRIPS